MGDIVMVCGHCGNRTVFEMKGEYFMVGDWEGYQINIKNSLLRCKTCSMPTLEQSTYNPTMDIMEDKPEIEILYPAFNAIKNLPETIEKRYTEALKVKNISPSLFAVMAGRTLEAVCKHEDAKGNTLSDKINNHARSERKRIPQILADMAHQLRQIRNLGMHDKEYEVTIGDVPIILDFVDAILEYLYVAPSKINRVKKRLNKQKQDKGQGKTESIEE